MITATASRPAATSKHAGAYDRVFYSGMAIGLAATVFAGFSGTYYFALFRTAAMTTVSGGPFTTLVHLHAVLFTAWVLLFVVQTALVAQRRVRVHRSLGVAGGLLAAAMVVVGLLTAVHTAARGGAPPGVDPRSFLVVPLFDLVLFASFVTTALLQRRHREAHKRLMLLASISLVAAAIARLGGINLNPLVFFGLAFVFIVVGAMYDFLTRGRVHPAYIWGGVLFAVSVPLRLAISGTAAWLAFADWLMR